MPAADRFLRHLCLRQIGPEGQQRLAGASVALVGCGALGTNQAQMLARAGVGRLRLIDRDLVEPSNLPRQVLFDEDDVASRLPKAVIAARKLSRVDSRLSIEPVVAEVNAANIERLIDGCEVVLDACDNLETRYLLNDACVKAGKPWVYGGVVGTSGMVLPVRPGLGPCLRCVFPEMPPPGELPTPETMGVLNAAPAIVGAMQAVEALKLLLGQGSETPALITLELWEPSFQKLSLGRDARCPCCGARRFDFLATPAAPLRRVGTDAFQISASEALAESLSALGGRLGAHGAVRGNEHLLELAAGAHRLTLFADGRAIVGGVRDADEALAVYRRLVGP
jgi:adenylyltransferase/sulfurtransferase